MVHERQRLRAYELIQRHSILQVLKVSQKCDPQSKDYSYSILGSMLGSPFSWETTIASLLSHGEKMNCRSGRV